MCNENNKKSQQQQNSINSTKDSTSINIESIKTEENNAVENQTYDQYLSVIFNIVKNGLGACALFLGSGYASGGIISTSALLVIVGIFCSTTFSYIGICCHRTNSTSYKEIFEIAVGKKYGIILSLMMFIMTFLIVLIYMVTISMFANEFFIQYAFDLSQTHSEFTQEATVFAIIGVCIAIPCSFFQDIKTYRYGSFIGFVSYIYVSILLIVIACMGLRNIKNEELSYSPAGHGIHPVIAFGFIGVMGQAYTCHYNTPNFYKQCEGNMKTLNNVTVISFAIIFCINFIMGFVSYYNFGPILFETGAPCIYFFPKELDVAKYIGMLLISLNMAFGVGITLFPNRIAINELYQKLYLKEQKPGDEMPYTRHVNITLILIVALVTSSMLCVKLEGFSILVTLVGIACSVFGPFITFIFPCVCYIQICKPDTKRKLFAYGIISVGILSFISGIMELIGRKTLS